MNLGRGESQSCSEMPYQVQHEMLNIRNENYL